MKDKFNEVTILRKRLSRYKKFFFFAVFLWVFIYLIGFTTGWWVFKGSVLPFPQVTSSTRLLVLAPHPDDETLMTGGLIQRVLVAGGKVKIIFLTNGDGSRTTAAFSEKKIDLSSSDFISLGEMRMKEASNAAEILGLGPKDIYFLGFPDQGLSKLLQQNYFLKNGAYTSPTTRVNHVPYNGAYRPGEDYVGENLISNVLEIIKDFQPNMVVAGHPKDNHPDHRASSVVVQNLKSDFPVNSDFFYSLIHYKDYPNSGKLLYPPKKLFPQTWVSLNLSSQEILTIDLAIKAHKSQYQKPEDRFFFERLISKNEIFDGD